MLIVGHRGARGEAPENTLSGFSYLKSLGVSAVELDVYLTQDNHLVVFHDEYLSAHTSGTGKITEHTLAELKNLDLKFAGLLPQERLPTLHEVFDIINDFKHIQLEVKINFNKKAYLIEIAQQLAALYARYPQQIVITSFSLQFLTLMQKTHPNVVKGVLLQEYCFGHPDYDDEDYDDEVFWPANKAIALAQELQCQYMLPYTDILTKYPDFISKAHTQGFKVSTWTSNEANEMIKLQSMGVDSVITDYPCSALRWLNRR